MLIEENSLFAGLSESELRIIKEHSVIRKHPRNAMIIDKGDDDDALYTILSGKVDVFIADEQGRQIILNTQGPGEYFGELALLGDMPRTASVMAVEDCRFRVLTKPAFLKILSEHPDIAFNLIRYLVQRVASLSECVGSLALKDVYTRLRTLLLESSEMEGDFRITGEFTQQRIANRIGATREMVSRLLKDLREGGYVSQEHRRYILHKPLPENW